ncbi:MAG: ROK family transcriptional regulator [Thermotogota bacterium]
MKNIDNYRKNSGLNFIEVKKNNRSTVLEILHSLAPISRADIASLSGLTRTTVTNIINELINVDFIEEVGSKSTKSGRKKTLLKIKKDAFKIIGINISRSNIKVGLYDTESNLLYSSSKEFSSDVANNNSIKILIEIIDSVIKNTGISIEDVNGIGIGIPAPIEFTTGKIIATPSYFEAWKDVNLKERLEKKYKVKTWIDNDANVGALGEKWFGQGKHYRDYIFVVSDIGFGSGIVLNGKLHRGDFSMAGEIGHVILGYKEREDYLENKSGFKYIINRLKERGENCNIDYILNKINVEKDEEFIEYAKEISRYAGMAIMNLISILDPQAVIIGGNLKNISNIAYKEINKIIDDNLFGPRRSQILFSNTKEDVVLKGAAALVLERIISDPYSYILMH